MRKVVLTVLFASMLAVLSFGQTIFEETIEVPEGFIPETVVMPPSPLTMQVLFIGGVDMVQATETYGNPATEAPAKQWHDFIGFTPDTDSDDLGWISINHERIDANDNLGDGGGMSVFKVRRDADTDSLIVLEQTLSDGRQGKFFNVDFVNTVGETGMNCGGIVGPDGRIWTAEEWFRTSNSSINFGGGEGVRDTSDFTITSDLSGWGEDVTVKKYENFNYMVEIDPREAVAVRKQYNWGRQGFEGGAFTPDGKEVLLGWDGSPGFITKFVADVPGDYTNGTLYLYKQDNPRGQRWLPVENTPENMLDLFNKGVEMEGTLIARIEWVTYDEQTQRFYMTETGRDNIGERFALHTPGGAVIAAHHHQIAAERQGLAEADTNYTDRYGRVLYYDPATEELGVHINGGPYSDVEESPAEAEYFDTHLSNPDGLNVMTIDGSNYLVICEDLNGTSHGRTPAGISNRTCELFLLDLAIEAPTVDDLIRISVVPAGAEVTGVIPTPDGKSLLVNSQHPSSENPFPFNNSLTYAIHGFDKLTSTDVNDVFDKAADFSVFPNPTTRYVQFSEVIDVAIYNAMGQRVKVYRQVNEIDVSSFEAGTYFLQANNGRVKQLIIQ